MTRDEMHAKIRAEVAWEDGQGYRRSPDDVAHAIMALLPRNECEIAVGEAIYARIDALINSVPGSPEAAELIYLTKAVGEIEEYGHTDWTPSEPTP